MQGTSKHKVLFIHSENEIHQNQTCIATLTITHTQPVWKG